MRIRQIDGELWTRIGSGAKWRQASKPNAQAATICLRGPPAFDRLPRLAVVMVALHPRGASPRREFRHDVDRTTSAAGDTCRLGGVAPSGRRASRRPDAGGLRARQRRPCGPVGDHLVAFRGQRICARSAARIQLHGPAGARRRYGAATRPLVHGRSAQRACGNDRGRAQAHRRPRVALVASSRGGYAVRNNIRNGGVPHVSHVVLCGVPTTASSSPAPTREASSTERVRFCAASTMATAKW
jgi:hypothetical protein